MRSWAGILAICLASCGAIAAGADRPPNFVVLLADDLGYGDLGSYGHSSIRTPQLDRMAAEGVRLTEFYSPAPTCTPARISLLTGRYPQRSGLVRVLAPLEKWGIPASEITLAEALRERGYTSAMIGKWHLGGRKPYRPERHGFDLFYGVLYSNDMSKMPIVHYPRFELLSGNEVVESPAKQKNLTKNYTWRAEKFMEENRERPFFLYLAYTMPHRPVAASQEFRGQSEHGLYGDAVEEIDWSVGQILSKVGELGLEKDTLVIFTSDNGPWVRGASMKKIKGGSTGGLRGGKGTTWEGGVRVPMIARWPGVLPQRQVRDGITSIFDIFSTLVQLAGGSVPQDRIIDGKDMFAYLQGKAPAPHDDFFYYFRRRLFAVRSGDWKLHLHKRDASEDEELEEPQACDPPLLYNLANDATENSDVAASHPEVVERLKGLGEKFDAGIEPVMDLPARTRSMYMGVATGAPKNPDRVPKKPPPGDDHKQK